MPSSHLRPICLPLVFSSLLLSEMAFAKKKKKNTEGADKIEEISKEDEDEIKMKNTGDGKRTSTGKKIRVRKKDEIDSETSEAKREALNLELQADLIGFTPSPTSGGSIGIYVTPSQVIELRYGNASAVFSDTKSVHLGASLKTFWGNSFYTRVGLAKRDFDIKYDIINADENGESDFTTTPFQAKVSSLGAEFYIGNQWQWDAFTMGVDWLGYYAPMSVSGIEKVDQSEKNYDSGSVSSLELELAYPRAGQLAFSRLFLGVAF